MDSAGGGGDGVSFVPPVKKCTHPAHLQHELPAVGHDDLVRGVHDEPVATHGAERGFHGGLQRRRHRRRAREGEGLGSRNAGSDTPRGRRPHRGGLCSLAL